MKEKTTITIVVLIFILFGLINTYYTIFSAPFSFSQATITADGPQITETLIYVPNKDYHTLYRNFITPIRENFEQGDSIHVTAVACSGGVSYTRDFDGNTHIRIAPGATMSLQYTENNEYGCTYGEDTGFKQGTTYAITSQYTLHPSTVFLINGQYYIKFVAYSSEKHPLLSKSSTLQTSANIVAKSFYLPDENVIVYLPINPQDMPYARIIDAKDFVYENSVRNILVTLFFSLIPAIVCFFGWFFFGREKREEDLPHELSQYPQERKAWEVVAYFHPPFGELDKQFIPTMIMDFYNRKIIDVKEIDGDTYMSINEHHNQKLDDVEQKFLDFLNDIYADAKISGNAKGTSFNMNDAITHAGALEKKELQTHYKLLQKRIKEKSKEYIDYRGNWFVFSPLAIIVLLYNIMGAHAITLLYIVCFITMGIIAHKSALFIRYKKEYYPEYQKWQGFKNYLKTMDSMKKAPPQAVVLWNQYLVYATALGVEKTVIKKFQEWKIITPTQSHIYMGIYHTSSATGAVGGNSGGAGGGFGGAAGGGVGGGGGGGR